MSYAREIFQPLIDDGQMIRDRLMSAMDAYQAAIERVKRARAAAKDAQEDLAMAEAEYVAEAIGFAELGQGPLSGIAKTSKAYQYALDNMLAQARKNGLGHVARAVQNAQAELLNSEIVFEQESVRFSALKHIADLQAAMINGTRA